MVQLWIPKDELKADLEDQARKRLEEIQREAERRRQQIMDAGQEKLNDQRLQDAMTRFNSMVDPLIDKGREALSGAGQAIGDTSEQARRLVEQAQAEVQQAPVPDALQALNQPPAPTPAPTPPTPPAPEPMLGTPTPPAPGLLGQLGQPSPPPPGIAPTPDLLPPPAPPPAPMGPMMGAPSFPGGPGQDGQDGMPGFSPPGLDGLGSALADRFRGVGDKVTEGRDQAMELASKSLDVAQQALSDTGQRRDEIMARPARDVLGDVGTAVRGFRPPGVEAIRDAALPLLTGPSAASQTAEAIAPWTPEMQRNQEAWESYQGKEREGAGLGGLLSGAAAAARRFEQQTREQGETLLGKGTQGEGLPEQLQAGFGYALAPYGAAPEIARGAVEEATGSPLAGAAAYGAASILGPGGIASYLRRNGPVALRMLTNPRVVPELLKNDPTGTMKALALVTVGGVGGTGLGIKTGIDAIREGASPQEAAAQAVTTAADLLQISEAAGIPIEAAARVRGLFPGGLRPGQLPPPPGMEGGLPGAPERPGAPAETPAEPSLPGERPLPEERPLPDEEGARGIDGVAVTPRRPRTFTEIESAPGERLTPLPEEPVSRARQYQQEQETADAAVARAEARRGPLDFVRRFGENLAEAQGMGPGSGVLFGNAPTTAVVGRGDEARRVGAIEQTIGGPAGEAPRGVTGADGEALTPGRVIPETEISRFGQIRRGKETISPETGALTGTIEDRVLREYRKRDLTAEEEKALGVGAPGDPQRGGLLGEPRVASFRHPGWMARNYTPDYDAKLMRFEVPDKEAMAVLHPTWKPHLRTGKKGEYQYTEIKPKKGQSALDAFEEADDAGAAPGKDAPKGTKVLYDTATGEEINITRHPDMPWKPGQAPITDTTGMTRDGRLEEIASTPLSYQRAALLRGLGLRNFYPDYGRFFGEDLARNSKPLFKELNAIFGAVASQASPETNLQRALAVMSAGRDFYMKHGRPPDFNELTILTSTNFDGGRMHYTDTVTDADLGRFPAGGITGADVQKVIDIWEQGAADIGAGWKTPVFGQNLESGALNRADPLSVPDTHMFRGRGHTQTGGGPPQGVNSDLRALGITNATVVRLADEFGLTPFQVQSALWFVYKNELAPFNATDKAQIRNKAGTSDEASPAYLAEAAKHDPWPKAMEEGPDGQPRVMTVPGPDGTPMEVRQGTLPAVLRHVASVAGRFPAQVKGQPRVARPRMDLMQAFRDLDRQFSETVGRDSLTEAAADARLTFNGKLVGNPSRGGTVDLDIPGEGTQRVRSMEITPENIERAAFKLSQEAPVAIVPVDGLDGEGLGRLGYDSQRGQIEALREASIPHEVVLTNRPFTAGEPGKAETKSTARIIFPGASLDTARYAASLLGQRAGADEVAVSWPTRPGAGRPVVSIEHPEGLEWTTEEIAKYPWASTLVGRANVSPDGRTLFFADLKPEEAKSVPWEERVGAVLEDADVPPELVRRSADFGIERVGADQYGEVLSRAPLQAAGEVGQRAQAQFEAGEAVPGSTPTNVDLREYAGPERFRPEGAPVGSLGIRDGQAGGPLRDTLDERLQAGQMVAGAVTGGVKGQQINEEQEEDNPLKAGARILGGGLLGATVGANAPNARRLYRAARAAGMPSVREVPGAVGRFGRELAGDEAGTFGAVSKGEPTGEVPKRGELRGEELGLGDLEDPDNLTRLLIDPPAGLTGEQINEIGRAAFKRLRTGMTPEQTAQQREVERSRRLMRRREGIEKVDAATTPEEVADAAAEAEDAAKRGEIPHSDADAVRGRAARKLQQQKGEDGPPPPGEIDKQIAASRARKGTGPSEAPDSSAPAPAPEGEGLTQPIKPPPPQVWRDMGDLTDEGVTVTETPEEVARRERVRRRAREEEAEGTERGQMAPPAPARTPSGSADEAARAEAAQKALRRSGQAATPLTPGEAAQDRPPAQDMARVEAQSVAPFPESEPPTPGRGPELDPYTRTADLGQTPARVTSGSKAEAQQAEAARAFARRYEGVTGPITSPETEAAAKAVPTEPAERKIPRLVAPDGTLLTRAQAAAQLARDAARPGGWGAIRDEWNEGLSDVGKLLAAAGRGIKVGPKELDEALAQVGGNGRGPVKGGPRVDGLSPRDREKLTKFRPEHVFDALGTMMRMNLVVTPEGFGRNLFSTTVALPLRFYEAATAPLFDRMWGVIPGQGERGPDAAHSSEALAMAEGLYRSWAAGIANSMNVMRKGDTRLSEAQMGDASGAEADFRDTALGKAMGTFFRPMTATDAFLKTLNEGMEAYRLSHRQARNEFDAGKLGKDARSIRSRMIEIMSTPDQKFIDQVQQAGEYNTYNQKAGHIANMLEGWKSLPAGTPPAVQGAWRLMMNVLIPFVRISTNVMKFGLERTVPGGAISTAAGKGRADRSERLAKMSEGALILGGLWGMQQAGMIEVSGALPQDPDERDEWEMQGKTPFSMRVGDRWYDPRSIPGLYENVAMLGMMTDAKRKVDDKEARGEEVGAGDFLSEIPNAIPQYLGQVGVRPAFGSVVDALGMMTASNDRDKDYHASRLKRSLVGQLAPASGAMRQIGNLTDPYQRDAQTVPEMAAAAYPFFRENLPEKLDARGAPLPSENYEFPLAGLTSSRMAREDALLPREYLGSSDARMDAEIGSAIRAVQLYESDPRAHPRPTVAQRNLYYRFRSRKNPARQRANKAADRLDFQRKSAHADLAEGGLFDFRAPTGLLEMVGR